MALIILTNSTLKLPNIKPLILKPDGRKDRRKTGLFISNIKRGEGCYFFFLTHFPFLDSKPVYRAKESLTDFS